MFNREIIDAVIAAADDAGIPRAAALAVVECETSGNPYEADGTTPRFLFERHKFYAALKRQAEKLRRAIAAGLAIPAWDKKTQYRDMKTSEQRQAVMAKARNIDEEAANASASWGLGQIMGFNYAACGLGSATDMVRFMTAGRVKGQVAVMFRFIKSKGLDRHLRNKNFASFALGYNGEGYRKNNYDGRMEAAEKRWARRLENDDLGHDLSVSEVRALQSRLKQLGYQVGKIDGQFGPATTGALSSFQAHEGIKVTGKFDDETRKELATALPIERAETRAEATADDLREMGSKTVKAADSGTWFSKILMAVGLGGGAEKVGLIDQAQEVAGKVESAKGVIESIKGIVEWVAPYWWVAAIVLAFFMYRAYGDVIKERLRQHVSGDNMSR